MTEKLNQIWRWAFISVVFSIYLVIGFFIAGGLGGVAIVAIGFSISFYLWWTSRDT